MSGDDLRVSADPGWAAPVVGIMGGLGPLAGATFLRVLTLLTPAAQDQEHVDAVLLSHATTPDRTSRIKDDSAPDPAPVLFADARRLEALGAAVIAVPCNSAHPFIRAFRDQIAVPMLDIVEITAAAAVARANANQAGRGGQGARRGRIETTDTTPRAARIGVLATEGTRAAGTYTRAVRDLGAETIDVTDAEQRDVTRIIYDQVKAGMPTDLTLLMSLVDALVDRGSDAVVLGCTELSVAYDEHRLTSDDRLVDSVDSLARATLQAVDREPLR